MSLDATKFVLLSVLTLIETICTNIWAKERIPIDVDIRMMKIIIVMMMMMIMMMMTMIVTAEKVVTVRVVIFQMEE